MKSLASRRTRFTVLASVALLISAAVAAAVPAAARSDVARSAISGKNGFSVHYAVNKPVCAQPKNPLVYRCFAVRRTEVAKGTPGAFRFLMPNAIGAGPAGGLTPDDLAAAYQYNPDLNRTSQVVAIVDWFDDPSALSDLNTFDAEYGLPAETSTSFRKVNELGAKSPLPKKDHNASVEISLDIQSVRGVCHTCRILLVEANEPLDADLVKAENRAASMGATEISNSFGAPEHPISAKVRASYNHPGVVITASTGDDGWFGWDFADNPPGSGLQTQALQIAQYPSSDPHVVSVGGTRLDLNSDGTRADETVWNENGLDDQSALQQGFALGAGGGGCSTFFAAPAWQKHYPGYSKAGCNGMRLNADISADADSATGLDIFDSFAPAPAGWITVGGTSLASPLTAALFALAGGSGGAAYPASSLYTNGVRTAGAFFDVIAGGNGFCGGDTTANCSSFVHDNFKHHPTNPNGLGAGVIDCSFPRSGKNVTTAPKLRSECNAVPGYDGPSGIGAPNGLAGYQATNPIVSVTRPATLKANKALTFKATATERLTGLTVTSYQWNWGDGKTTTKSTRSATHTYSKPGKYLITLTVTDSAFQEVIRLAHIKVKS